MSLITFDKNSAKISLVRKADESLDLPHIENDKNLKRMNVDLSQVAQFGSQQIREWIQWINQVQKKFPNIKTTVEKVRPAIIRTQSIISGVFPESIKISSLYLPYFCETCDSPCEAFVKTDELLRSSPSDKELIAMIEKNTCPNCQGETEIDSFPPAIINFLRSHA